MKSYRENDIDTHFETLIESNGYSRAQFSELIGISRQYLQKILKGESKMNTDLMIKSAEILNVEIEELFGEKCLICKSSVSTLDYKVDRLGNATKDRITEKNVHLIYDCPHCGYLQFPEEFIEKFDFVQLATDEEYSIIDKVIQNIREEENIKWYETITLHMLTEPNYEKINVLLKSKTTSTVLTIEYDNDVEKLYDIDYEVNTTPSSYSYSTTVTKDDFVRAAISGWNLFLYETPTSKEIIAEGFYLGDNIGTKKNNEMRVFKGAKIPIQDKLTKSIGRKRDSLKLLKYKEENKHYVLTEDGNFTSPSIAAAVILGKECSGTRLWKDEHGVDLYTLINTTKDKNVRVDTPVKKFDCVKTNTQDNIEAIKQILSKKHDEYMDADVIPFMFTNNPDSDNFIKDLNNNPEAFFIGCLMDRGVKAELAWYIPYRLKELLGSIKISDLEKLSYEEIEEVFVSNNIHRYKNIMADVLYKGVQLVSKKYDGNPANIWKDTKDSNVVVKRFKEFKGVGNKIATMAVNILYRDFKIPFNDLAGIDISPDSQVLKVFKRLGLIEDENNTYEVIAKAREMNKSFPGIYDVTTWEIGRNYCHNVNPDCSNCPLDKYCPKKPYKEEV
jgi:endonuclease III/transcriptional regulator with XRE-family HTH domain